MVGEGIDLFGGKSHGIAQCRAIIYYHPTGFEKQITKQLITPYYMTGKI